MDLSDLLRRRIPPEPWSEGEKIPWHDPDFSRRMLAEHLSGEHDAASRRAEKIDRHVEWIHNDLLGGRTGRVLDLGCGPGLYSQRLARRGHECVGIDFAPASIDHAVEQADGEGLSITYRREDIRQADFGRGCELVMLIFGEFNVFRPAEGEAILTKAHAALTGGGMLLLEPHTFQAVQGIGRAPSAWYSSESGLFSDRPHLCLEESFWDEAARTATTRYFIIDVADGSVTRHGATCQAYTDDEYRALLSKVGFEDVQLLPSLTGDPAGAQEGLFVITARKPAE